MLNRQQHSSRFARHKACPMLCGVSTSASMTDKCCVAGSSEERMMQLLPLIKSLLEKYFLSCSRNLAADAPVIVPVCSQVQAHHLLHADQDHTRSTPCKHPDRLLLTFPFGFGRGGIEQLRTSGHKWFFQLACASQFASLSVDL